jgi:cysteine-rich repeat protein
MGALLAAGIVVLIPLAPAAAAERCQGHGALESSSLTTWEGGLGAWSAGTHNVANQGDFDTPDWSVVGSLPDARAGNAAFVPDLEIGDCAADDESGALNLDSPLIVIPGDALVPRISVDHWFQTESGFDGGNFKISVNGSAFNLIPAEAIEVVPYNATLFPAVQDETIFNTNPLADQDAYTGTFDDLPGGAWVQSRINLLGIAAAGDSVRLRLDFGVDGCTFTGQEPAPVGWYVDEVEFYRCAAELPPSDCGNGLLDAGEECDDGNDFIEDGCSNTCQVEEGWDCTLPEPPGDVADPGFEAGTPNPFWDEVSTKSRVICDAAGCGTGGGSGPSDGTFWAWFGGAPSAEDSVSQSVVIPATATELVFDLEIPRCDTVTDFVEVLIDDTPVWMANASSPLCDQFGYTQQQVELGAFADGGSHQLKFHGKTAAVGFSNFFVDRIAIPGTPSVCTQEGEATSLTLVKQVTNDDGGTALPSAWTLSATGPTPFSGPGPTVSSGGSFAAGTYDLAESGGPAGYTASAWVCAGGAQNDANTITLALGEAATCTITNNDLSAGDVIFEDGFESSP